jgi:large subunit ribosomal protein L24
MRILKHRKTAKKRLIARHARNVERVKTHITAGDTVRVMRGDDRGKEGKVMRVHLKTGRVTIEGVNIVKKHRKARGPEDQGGIIEQPAPVALSNVMLLDASSGAPTRVRVQVDEDGTKERVSVKGGDAISRARRAQ